MTCPTCGGVLADMRGTAFNAKQMKAAGVCALWADDSYECAFKDRPRRESCSMCRKLLSDVPPVDPTFPFRTEYMGKRYVCCSPQCAFDLGAKLAPYGRAK
jgi:hypothetical protein